MAGFITSLKDKLTKTRQGFTEKIDTFFARFTKIDEDLLEELEEILIQADIGAQTSFELVEDLRCIIKEQRLTEPTALTGELQKLIQQYLGERRDLNINDETTPTPLTVYLIVGVNGVGKTTTIGKMAHQYTQQNKKVVLAAADTFRAAASEQLQIWAGRAGADIIKHGEGADPAAVVFDALQAARARKADYLIIDTAGRLHNKINLMNELNKIKRVITREISGAPHEVLLVLDATTGQNAIQQVKSFREASDLTGVILTKMDGTAKGGVIVGLSHEAGVAVKLIGVGEGLEDLRPFDPQEFAQAIFER
ncbi:MAG: signal recognition particle-docking protein FtsY [Peptococcaceae bacterium]|nr:signal recognition particle-docking protein FtsY [Peptococcaceae bacterium]